MANEEDSLCGPTSPRDICGAQVWPELCPVFSNLDLSPSAAN